MTRSQGARSQGGGDTRRWVPVLVGVAAAMAALGLWLALGPDENEEPVERAASPAPAAESPAAATAPIPPMPAPPTAPTTGLYDAGRVIQSGESVAIALRSLPGDGPAVFQLEVPAPPAGTETLAARIVAEGRPPLELDAAVTGEGRDRVRVEIERGWLARGRAVIEVRTTERSHLPLRRYALELY